MSVCVYLYVGGSLVIVHHWLNPLTAGAVHIRFLHFLLAHHISAFKPDKAKT